MKSLSRLSLLKPLELRLSYAVWRALRGIRSKLTGYVLGSMVGGLFGGRWISCAPCVPRR